MSAIRMKDNIDHLLNSALMDFLFSKSDKHRMIATLCFQRPIDLFDINSMQDGDLTEMQETEIIDFWANNVLYFTRFSKAIINNSVPMNIGVFC